MSHTRAMIIKLISTFVLLYIILGLIFDLSIGNVLLITLVVGIAAYLIGDLMILPRTNNTTATIADFGLAFLIIWALCEAVTLNDQTMYPSLIAAIGVALFEFFFHKYLARNMNETRDNGQRIGKLNYQTEMADEFTPVRGDVRSDRDDHDNPLL